MCYYDLLGTFCLDEEVFLLLFMEGSFVLLPTGEMAAVVDNRSHVTTRQWMETVCNMLTIVAAWNVAVSQIMEFIAVKLVVQQGCKYVILAPLQNKLGFRKKLQLAANISLCLGNG